MPLSNLKTSAQAARKLGVTVRYVSTLVARGKLEPAAKLPGETGAYLFADAELDRYLDARAPKSAAHAANVAA